MGTKELSGESACPSPKGKFRALNDISPSYWDARNVTVGDGIEAVASLDMVRAHLTFTGDGAEWLSERAETFPCDDLNCWISKIRPGSWHELWTFKLGESSATLGIGLIEGSCKVNRLRGLFEFNPSRVCGDERFWRLFERVRSATARAEVKRYDLALDMRLPRECLRLSKDRRSYAAYVGHDSLTEYLGRKNAPAYCKLYDKQKELGLGEALTRCELTCDGAWSAPEVVSHWPQLHGWHVAEDSTRDWVRVLGILIAEASERGEAVEPLISMLGRGSRPKVRKYLRTPLVELPEDVADYAVAEASSWADRMKRDQSATNCE